MEEILGQAKWTTINHNKGHLHPKKMILYMWWDWKGVLCYEPLPKNQTINSNKYLSIRPTEINTQWKVSRINRKHILFHQDNPRLCVSLMTRQKLLTAWLGSSYSSALFIRHCTLVFPFIYFSLYKILLMEEVSILWKTVKST